jgi:hypothetical protein
MGGIEFQYIYAGYLILGGFAAAWIGHDVGDDPTDGKEIPESPHPRFWVRLFGVGCMACGLILLTATLLGFRGQGAEGPPIP